MHVSGNPGGVNPTFGSRLKTARLPYSPSLLLHQDARFHSHASQTHTPNARSLAGRWYRDPSLPIQRNEITRFPHAVLEVKLSLNEGQSAPSWVQELLDSGYLTEVGLTVILTRVLILTRGP